MNEITVVLSWSRLQNWQYIKKMRKDILSSGIFMITGYHSVFGNNSLLYIGNEFDTFFDMPSYMDVRAGRFNDPPNSIHIYRSHTEFIDYDPDYPDELWKSLKKGVEALLTFHHSPPFNSGWGLIYPDIGFVDGIQEGLRIINIGDRASLCQELSHYGQKLALSIDTLE